MIGLALVTFVAIFSAGIFKSFEDAVDELFIADYAITATNTFTGIDVAVGKSLIGKPGVSDVTPIRQGSGHFLGSDLDLSGVAPNIATGVRSTGRPGARPCLRSWERRLLHEHGLAKSHHLKVGLAVSLEFPSGQRKTVRLIGTYKEPNGGSPFGDATVSTQLFDKYIPAAEGPDGARQHARRGQRRQHVDPRGRRRRLRRREGADARTEFKTNFLAPVKKIINLLYALLALAVIVSLVGIINTLVLDDLRAHPRDRDAARGRHDPAAGADDDPLREHRHRADGRGARDGRRRFPRRPSSRTRSRAPGSCSRCRGSRSSTS
jgi:putative ABC transport system permease protein